MAPERLNPTGSTPVPDPTILTTQQLTREVLNLKEIVFTRLDAMDRAIVLFNENLTRAPTEVDKQITHLRELMRATVDGNVAVEMEKFASIQTQFRERDVRTEQTQRDSKVAVDAALQAAKEAVGAQNTSNSVAIAKSEASTVKQIDQQASLIQQVAKGADEKINDLKERLTRLEGKDESKIKQVVESQGTGNLVVGIVGAVLAVLAIAAAIGIAVYKH